MDRVKELLPTAAGRSPTSNMKKLLDILDGKTIIPDVDKYYVFVYKAKTPRIQYDQHPFVAVTAVYQWGFTGYNFHWEGSRTYTWGEVLSNFYEVEDHELTSVQKLPIARIKST